MPSNKNQHYVPQFFLKNFSSDKKSVSSFLIGPEKLLSCVSIKNQCSKDYFYPDAGYERRLSELECRCREIINGIVTGQKTKLSEGEKSWLRAFVLMQKSRTQHEATIVRQGMDDMKAYLESRGMGDELKKKVESFDYSEKNTLALLLSTMKAGMNITVDLSCKILEYSGEGALLTSDDPVFMYNPFLEHHCKLNYGLAAMGLMLFLPISDRHAVLFYDGNVYKIGHRKEQIVSFNDKKDLRKLNILTVAHADNVVFFKPNSFTKVSITQLVKEAKSFGYTERMKTEHFLAEDGLSELTHTYGESLYIGADFSFAKLLDKTRNFRLGDTIGVTDYSRPYCNAYMALHEQGQDVQPMRYKRIVQNSEQ